ncbi:MAG: ArpU family phage packaging/lysis transcriptional regulator [Bacillus sp. (in: firmicutes)]
MSQLSFFITSISKDVRREAEKLMSRYKILDAIIESRKMDLEPKMTQSLEASESQRGNQFYSSTESVALARMELEDYERTKRKLKIVYESLKPVQQRIWDERYIVGRRDIDVYEDLHLTDKTYYALKKEIVVTVAEAFGLAKPKSN